MEEQGAAYKAFAKVCALWEKLKTRQAERDYLYLNLGKHPKELKIDFEEEEKRCLKTLDSRVRIVR
jgi:hypothetical protein